MYFPLLISIQNQSSSFGESCFPHKVMTKPRINKPANKPAAIIGNIITIPFCAQCTKYIRKTLFSLAVSRFCSSKQECRLRRYACGKLLAKNYLISIRTPQYSISHDRCQTKNCSNSIFKPKTNNFNNRNKDYFILLNLAN